MEKEKEPEISERPFQFGFKSLAAISAVMCGIFAEMHYAVKHDEQVERLHKSIDDLDDKHHYQNGASFDEEHDAIMFSHISSDEFSKLMKDNAVAFQDVTCLHFSQHCTLTRENFAAIANLPNLLVLTILKGKDLRKEDIEPLRTSESLRDIVIEETPIPLAELKALFPNAEFVSKEFSSFPGTRKSIEGVEGMRETEEWEVAIGWLEEQLKNMGMQNEERDTHVGAWAEIVRENQRKMPMEAAREYLESIKIEK